MQAFTSQDMLWAAAKALATAGNCQEHRRECANACPAVRYLDGAREIPKETCSTLFSLLQMDREVVTWMIC